jgi:hypothetical protein
MIESALKLCCSAKLFFMSDFVDKKMHYICIEYKSYSVLEITF